MHHSIDRIRHTTANVTPVEWMVIKGKFRDKLIAYIFKVIICMAIKWVGALYMYAFKHLIDHVNTITFV